MPLSSVFSNFLGLGNNCEFGIVLDVASQGIGNAGLFHAVGFLDTRQIINGIETGLAGMFDDQQYAFVRPDGWPDYALDCLRYGFRFHTGVEVNDKNPDDELQKRLIAFRFRKRMFLEALSLGDKIFVYRNTLPFNDRIAHDLFRAIRRHGNGKLLFVRQDPSQQFASVEKREDGLYYGAIARLSNENPPVIDFAAWEKIARITLNLEAVPEQDNEPTPPEEYTGAGVQIHRPYSDQTMFFFTAGAEAGAMYQFEVLLYLPKSFRGTDISLAFMGWPSEEWTSANPDMRETWQHLSVTARAPLEQSLLIPCVNTSEAASGPFYTTAWTLRRL